MLSTKQPFLMHVCMHARLSLAQEFAVVPLLADDVVRVSLLVDNVVRV